MSNIKIMKVKEENFKDLTFLMGKLAKFEKLSPLNKTAKIRLKKDLFSKKPKCEAVLSIVDNNPAGYMIFFMTYDSFVARPIIYLEDLFVLKEYRKKGIGKVFFKLLAKTAEKRNCCRIEWCVLNWNKNAINFYEKLKGKPVKKWTHYRLEEKYIKKLIKK